MIIGACPYADCDEPFMIPIAASTPAYQKWNCEKCGRVIWTRHSRLDPWSVTEAEFHANYIVDEAHKHITHRSGFAVEGPTRPQ